MHIILVFMQAVKGFLKAAAKAWCEAHALFVMIYKLSKYLNNYIVCIKTHWL